VAWLDADSSLPLTLDSQTMVDDARFSVVRQHRHEWNLQIRQVTWSDRGQYRCTVNTSPIKSKLIVLHVKGRTV